MATTGLQLNIPQTIFLGSIASGALIHVYAADRSQIQIHWDGTSTCTLDAFSAYGNSAIPVGTELLSIASYGTGQNLVVFNAYQLFIFSLTGTFNNLGVTLL